jgi:DNA-binding SARP family transcriptional activator
MNSSSSFRLTLFGSPSITGGGGAAVPGRATQRHRLALLALLALAPDRAARRDKLQAYLWPERDTEHARQLLNQAVYSLRRALGETVILSAGEELRLNLQVLPCDAAEFEEHLASGELKEAVGLYRGPVLDGLFLDEAPAFEHWLDGVRERLASRYAKALEALAEAAEERQAHLEAVARWKACALHDPYDSRVALRLMQALAASGNRPGALQHAASHQRLLQRELGAAPDPSVVALAAQLRESPVVPRPTQPDLTVPSAPVAESPVAGVVAGEPPMLTPEVPPSSSAPRLPRARHAEMAILLLVALVLAVLEWGRLPGGTLILEADHQAAGLRPSTRNVAAYELYRRGSDRTLFRSDSTVRLGIEYFHQAIAHDSGFAAAWAGLGLMYTRASSTVPLGERDLYLTRAAEATARALALDDALAEAHATLGVLRMHDFDFTVAERHLRRAVALDPSSAMVHEWLVSVYLWLGQPLEALRHAELAVELDPLSPTAHAEVARALIGSDRCDEALAKLEQLAALQPPLLRVAPMTAECLARKRLYVEAMAVLQPQMVRIGRHVEGLYGHLAARAGQPEVASGIRDTLVSRWRQGNGRAFEVAVVSAGLGHLDDAFAWLDSALVDRSLSGAPGGQAALMLSGPLLEELRQDARYGRLRARLGLPIQ